MESVIVFLLSQFLWFSSMLEQNAGLIFGSALFAGLWVSGVIAIVRRASK